MMLKAAVALGTVMFGPPTPHGTSHEETLKIAACLIETDRSRAMAYLETDPDGDEERRAAPLLPVINCAPSQTSINQIKLHGAIADVILSENDGALLAQYAALQPTSGPRTQVAGATVGFATFRCAAKANPSLAANYLKDGARDAADTSGNEALKHLLNACVPAQVGLEIDSDNIRPRLAEAVYHNLTESH